MDNLLFWFFSSCDNLFLYILIFKIAYNSNVRSSKIHSSAQEFHFYNTKHIFFIIFDIQGSNFRAGWRMAPIQNFWILKLLLSFVNFMIFLRNWLTHFASFLLWKIQEIHGSFLAINKQISLFFFPWNQSTSFALFSATNWQLHWWFSITFSKILRHSIPNIMKNQSFICKFRGKIVNKWSQEKSIIFFLIFFVLFLHFFN